MTLKPKPAGPGSLAEVATPHCFSCRIAMRHSCTEDTAAGGTLRVYQCVKCGRTQSLADITPAR